MNRTFILTKLTVFIVLTQISPLFFAEIFAAEIPCPDGSEITISPYTATYNLIRDGDRVGKARRELKKLDDSWQLTMDSEARVMLVKFKYHQKSNFNWINSRPRPNHYSQKDGNSFKSAKKHQQTFDWQLMQESGNYNKKEWVLELDADILDRQTSLLTLRYDLLTQQQSNGSAKSFEYPVSYKGKINNDVYTLVGKELLETPAGSYQTLKFEKTHKNRNRISYYWLAKDLDYLPVRIKQSKDGEEQADMQLTTYSN